MLHAMPIHPALASISQGMLQAMQLVMIEAPRQFLGPRAEELSQYCTNARCDTHQEDFGLAPYIHHCVDGSLHSYSTSIGVTHRHVTGPGFPDWT